MGIYGNIFNKTNNISIFESGILEVENEYNNFSKITESFSILTENNIILEFSIKEIFSKIADFFKFLGRKIKELWEKIFGKKKTNEQKLQKAEENLKKVAEKKNEIKSDSNATTSTEEKDTKKEEKKNEESGVVNGTHGFGKTIRYKYFLVYVDENDRKEINSNSLKEIVEEIFDGVDYYNQHINDFNIKKHIENINNGTESSDKLKEMLEKIDSYLPNKENYADMKESVKKFSDLKSAFKLEKESEECDFKEFLDYYTDLVDTLKKLNETAFSQIKPIVDEMNKICEDNASFCEKINDMKIKDKNGNITEVNSETMKLITEGFKRMGSIIKDSQVMINKAQILITEYIAEIEHDSVIKYS